MKIRQKVLAIPARAVGLSWADESREVFLNEVKKDSADAVCLPVDEC